ncbi:MAG: sugar phosphorylase, partial [Anaerolineae bacterium]|nr:sugar phosphorylase [Anaerolineae bacterium]
MTPHDAIRSKLEQLYGDAAQATYEALLPLLEPVRPGSTDTLSLSEKDIVLISYGDHVQAAGENPLHTLHRFLQEFAAPTINTVHLLPFYPYSSDDGFSVIDYYAVNPAHGKWEDIESLRQDFRLMFDFVCNHISAQSHWFQKFLAQEPPYDDYFFTVPPETDLSQVVRPRALPLLTAVETAAGTRHVWTTFSADQIDLNYETPSVLIEMLKVLRFYVEHGASLIRLDAVAFLWKEIGTDCIHLSQTHLVIQLMRDFLNSIAPDTIIITETNVPHEENISYFGDGHNEAQMVYQFPLPPLVLHTLAMGDATALTKWAKSLGDPSGQTTFFNFTASHDGIGMRPATGLLSDAQIQALVERAEAHGGRVSY